MITSKDSMFYKHLKKYHLKKTRDKNSKFLVFGDHLIEEAAKANLIDTLFTCDPNQVGTLISANLMQALCPSPSAPSSGALVKKPTAVKEDTRILMLDNVQDPDNVGSLIRSASAFGFMKVVLSETCADVYNDKTIRASQGAIFQVETIRQNLVEFIQSHPHHQVLVTKLDAQTTIPPNLKKIILVLGNEGSGVSQDVMKLANLAISIKTSNVESLNVAIAGAIIMYEITKV